jgi:hypothetical protein
LNCDEVIKEFAKVAYAFSVPINFEKLISDGLLKKVGRSYYAENIKALPKSLSTRIKSFASTKNGIRVTFSKESKSLKKLSKKLNEHLK